MTASTSVAMQRIIDALRDHGCTVKEGSGTTQAQCPAHHDDNPSLAISGRRDGRGVLIHCHAGCSYQDVLAQLNMRDSDLYDDSEITGALNPNNSYTYSSGRQKIRKPTPNGSKEFFWTGTGKDDSLYGADRLGNAQIVYLCEGEKAVDFLHGLGQAAVATGGASRTNCDFSPLTGRHVLLIVDRDQAGLTWARKCEAILRPTAASVHAMQSKVPIVSADVVEHVCAGYELSEMEPVELATTNGHAVAAYTDGAHLLDQVHEFIGRFINYPNDYTHVAHTLWIAHTWLMDYWESTPRIAFLSPEPASGKSRALEVTEPLVPNPIHSVNVTPAYLFRKVGDPNGPPTILFDEIDTVFGPKAREHEEIRGLLNSGHRKGAVAGRCVVKGKRIETEEIPSYCAVALAGLHNLPDTIMTRSVVVRMRRRTDGEHVEPWRTSINGLQALPLREALHQWSVSAVSGEGVNVSGRPKLPEGIEDRDADVWEALVAIADLAGGHWPAKARVAAVSSVSAFRDEEPSLGVQLLWDIHTIFRLCGGGDLPANVAVVSSDLVANLKGIEEAPWANYGRDRKGLDTLRLSKLLRNYGIKSRATRFGTSTAKAYHPWQFEDAWRRYGTGPSEPPLPRKPETPETPKQSIRDTFWS